ncbi:Ino eighty subunit 1 [Microdochium nivale]|nr:Ino eighty subunit 1 [Microdochium nivale]
MSASPQSEAEGHDTTRYSASPSPERHYEHSVTMEPGATHRGKRKSRGATGAADGSLSGAPGKIRHLKKDDGEPLWRRDIQYDFLKAVFDDDRKVFTNNYEGDKSNKQNFADLYIDTMARSSKTSKVLRDKLLSDREAAKSMAMVCLLVNVGRMNTTLNFFPEMRAQLRTYHAIPSLQARQDASAYKQLQDAPRLKSILKGAAEDRVEPGELSDFKDIEAPRTNPVNLIFLLCASAAHVAELHFPAGFEFHDLIMKTKYTSQSRANAFLWVVWFYLESDFTEEGCEENPFGAGVDYGTDVANQGIPRLEEMTEEQEALENIDPKEEVDFGHEKQAHRARIIAADQAYMAEHQSKRGGRTKNNAEDSLSAAILPRIRPPKHESDMDSLRSPTPPRGLGRLSGMGGRRGGASLKYQIFEGSSPGPHNGGDSVMGRKPRPPTAHQLAVERNRNQRVEHILDRGLRQEHHKARKARRQEGVIIRARKRLENMEDPFMDSDEEDFRLHSADKNGGVFREKGFGGLCPLRAEEDDFGEEFSTYAASMRRVNRRFARWAARGQVGIVPPIRKPDPYAQNYGSKHRDIRDNRDDSARPGDEDEKDNIRARTNGGGGRDNGDVAMEDADDLDDMDRELLGIGSGADEDDDDDDLEDDMDGDGDDTQRVPLNDADDASDATEED